MDLFKIRVCRNVHGDKWLIPPKYRYTSEHPDIVNKAIQKVANFAKARHITVCMSDADAYQYICPKSSRFWFRGEYLERVKGSKVLREPSDDIDTDASGNEVESRVLKRQEKTIEEEPESKIQKVDFNVQKLNQQILDLKLSHLTLNKIMLKRGTPRLKTKSNRV